MVSIAELEVRGMTRSLVEFEGIRGQRGDESGSQRIRQQGLSQVLDRGSCKRCGERGDCVEYRTFGKCGEFALACADVWSSIQES